MKVHSSTSHELIPLAKSVKNLPAMQETQVQFLGWEDRAVAGKGFILR